jgi:DNA modification methylase
VVGWYRTWDTFRYRPQQNLNLWFERGGENRRCTVIVDLISTQQVYRRRAGTRINDNREIVMKIERVRIGSVQPHKRNARKHDRRNLEAIAASLKQFGQRTPIVVWQGQIIKGNGTWTAAKNLGWKFLNIVRADDLTSNEAEAYALADNKTSDLSEFDFHIVADIMRDLKGNVELATTGFSDFEIEPLLAFGGDADAEAKDAPPDLDSAPEINKHWTVRAGDLWSIGEHRLICGDAMEHKSYLRVLNNRLADMLLTDPPYGVNYTRQKESGKRYADREHIAGDSLGELDLKVMMEAAFAQSAASSRPGAYWYSTVPSGPLFLVFANDWHGRGILRQVLVWAKNSLVMGHSEYHYQHESILFGWVPGGDRHHNRDRTRTSLWSIDRPSKSPEHPSMKPVELFMRAIGDGSRKGEIILDPFIGSGTTMVAAQNLGRVCCGIELNPDYCAVVLDRMKNAFNIAGKKILR